MGEPEAVHPFSSNFRSQLSDVLSRPAKVSKVKQIPDDKLFLETEIDSYSGVQFEKRSSTNSAKRPPTPPKPMHRTFTFDKTNPFSKNSSETNNLSLPKYTEVNKPKTRPKVPPKPQMRSEVTATNTNTLPHTQKLPHESANISEEGYFFRVSSMPDLTPEIKHNKNIRASGHFLLTDSRNPSTPGYGHLNSMKQTDGSSVSVYRMAHNDGEYCDVIPESPVNMNDFTAIPKTDSRYENIYEDVSSKPTTSQELKLEPSAEMQEGYDSGYTLMCSPVTEINFTLARQSLYENCAMMSPNSDVFLPNECDVGSTMFPLGDPNRVGLREQVVGSQILAISKDHVSPTSSCDDHDSSAYSVQSSMASTTASSFQRVQVCFFPPSPPSDFYQGNSEIERPGSRTSGSSTKSRSSRSRIPVPIKPKQKGPAQHSMPEEPDQQLPPTPTPSPVVLSKNSSKKGKQFVLSPPTPTSNELAPIAGKGLRSSGKGARWYEKLGCIQTDTIQPSEPYGRPGERKRSKSLNREQRKSQFFLPVEPNASDPPSVQHT